MKTNKAYDFTLNDQDNKAVSLHDYLGQKVVLYFYPKDQTPGCTIQACNYRNSIHLFESRKIKVIGISKDSVKSHQKFIQAKQLNFTLLSDLDGQVVEAYEVWKEKSLFGKKYMGIDRTTFLIDESGNILHKFEKVNPDKDVNTVITFLDENGL